MQRYNLSEEVIGILGSKWGIRALNFKGDYECNDNVKKYCIENKLFKREDYIALYSEGMLPENFPNIKILEKSCGMSFKKFITGYSRNEFMPYNEAEKIVRPLKLSSKKDFDRATREHPTLFFGIKLNPDTGYKGSGWVSWYQFLGKDITLG